MESVCLKTEQRAWGFWDLTAGKFFLFSIRIVKLKKYINNLRHAGDRYVKKVIVYRI